MSILNKTLTPAALTALDLFLQGALAPLEGYLNREDHISVLTEQRLANGFLWPLPLALELSTAEKLQAQLAGRIALLDDEQRLLAEVHINSIYRLSEEAATLAGTHPDTWYVSGAIKAMAKVLHPTFNSLRHNTTALQQNLRSNGWNSVIAVHATTGLDIREMKQACEWLQASPERSGGVLVQISAADNDPKLHTQMRTIRSQIRCNAAKQVKLSILPNIKGLNDKHQLLLQALIARNFGATGFLINTRVPRAVQRWLIRHRDEIGLELIPAKRSRSVREQQNAVPDTLKLAA